MKQAEGKDLAGLARGVIAFDGVTGDVRSLSGAGEGHIEEAKLVDLPLFVSLIGLLFLKPSANPHFNKVAIRFEISGGKFRSPGPDGIKISGDTVHLLGSGDLDFEGNLDISLTPHFLSFRIPILDHIFDLLKKTFVRIAVKGKLEKPNVRLVSGAGLLRIPIGGGRKKVKDEDEGEEGNTEEIEMKAGEP